MVDLDRREYFLLALLPLIRNLIGFYCSLTFDLLNVSEFSFSIPLSFFQNQNYEIAIVLNGCGCSCSRASSIIAGSRFYYLDSKSGSIRHLPEFNDAEFELFTWCILQNRREMSLLFWETIEV